MENPQPDNNGKHWLVKHYCFVVALSPFLLSCYYYSQMLVQVVTTVDCPGSTTSRNYCTLFNDRDVRNTLYCKTISNCYGIQLETSPEQPTSNYTATTGLCPIIASIRSGGNG